MSNKTIQINPELFNLNGGVKNSSRKKEKKVKPKILVKPTTLKRELLSKIKNYQKKSEEKLKSNNSNYSNNSNNSNKKKMIIDNSELSKEFDSEFNKSLGFLQELSKKKDMEKREKREKKKFERTINQPINRTVKKPYKNYNASNIFVNLELPKEFDIDTSNLTRPEETYYSNQNISPPYGCLKNGNKPTYREWKRETQKNIVSANPHNKLMIENYKPPTTLSERESMLYDFKNEQAHNHVHNQAHNQANKISTPVIQSSNKVMMSNEPIILEESNEQSESVEPMILDEPISIQDLKETKTEFKLTDDNEKRKKKDIHIVQRNTKTLKYRLGKLDNNKVSILIKNRDTRKKVKQELTKLKKTSIIDVKNYLRQHNLIKSGSNAPNDVLRELYEQAMLSGEINNTSKENLIHNYFNS